ncbi:MAG: 23S rRNA (uracil(1939)-C(5))-methyltransferase RlmD [Merismopedia sp. SIO2A8]|nr:23S rRNA (uracil(1939)-C(5))-methyltransferase RlmD [Merismopedia sp. SIO2A8]
MAGKLGNGGTEGTGTEIVAESTRSKSIDSEPNWQQGAIATVTIESLSNRGDGVGRWNGGQAQASKRVLFIPDAVPGDRIRVRLVHVKPSFGHGKIVDIIDPSPHRVTPSCIVADKCGGCQWQAVNYEMQLQSKYQEICQSLERVGGFAAPFVHPVMPSQPLQYRNKVTYPVGRSAATDHVQIGYYQKGSHKLVNLNQCPVQDDAFDPLLAEVKQDIQARGWSIYDERTHSNSLRHLSLRRGRRTGELLLTLVSRDRRLKGLEEQAEQWLERYPALVGVCLNINYKRTNAIFGDETLVVAGQDHIREIFAGLELTIRPTTFFQVNTEQAEQLLKTIQSTLALTGNETVVDAYCGIGTLSLPLAQQVQQVIGIESHPKSITQALQNAAANHIDNVGFYEGRVEALLPRLSEVAPTLGIPDVVVLDPPRKGCDGVVLDTLRSLRPPRIVYVSCNSATLARDLKILCGSTVPNPENHTESTELAERGLYQLDAVHPFDFFPQTAHVEAIAFLSLV